MSEDIMETITIHTPTIHLDQAMKLASWVSSGAEAKIAIRNGEVLLNGNVCTMRGKKIKEGDHIVWDDQEIVIRQEP
ncbi:MAG: RNA-binding S4 domain-containing protein [Peptoniphilaceae bacterium]|nr:RNA-binding S4 domain-containing protein [Peptoniphilaceae bacterium]